MGAEEFRVRVKTLLAARLAAASLLTLQHVRRAKWADSFIYEDAKHVFDLAVTPGEHETTLKVGFALCQEASVDELYVAFVLRVAALVRASSILVEGQQAAVFRPYFAGVREHVLASIVEPRRLWQLEFGAETAKLGCDDAMRTYFS